MNIFIAEASGAIGAMTPILAQQNHRVVAMTSTPVIDDVLDGGAQRPYPM